ncbi:MAG: hypothetical protein AYP45_04305 [Candidatus Brocadia carolinensis]|uniref:Uncharacterized protein n=1 Tax=Candidatus Brocadia carolinensis TaxID=1004156 RepID=A0A1V4AW61_9BACT|nr:MAG: hypothetical protein AYP45_04305 [Candidatus Brocadia caroliniensis]
MDLSLSRFLDILSYNYKGFQAQITEVSVGEIYDDNVTFTDRNEKDDFITLTGFGLGIKYEGKSRSLDILGNVDYQTFAKNSDFNNITTDLFLNFKNEFSDHDRISLMNDFSYSDAPLFNQGEGFFDDQFGRSQGRFEYFKNKLDLDYTRDMSKQLTAIARYDNQIDLFSGSVTGLRDSFLNKLGLGAEYLFSSTTTSLFSYDFTNRRFEGGADASINEITAGARQYLTKKIYFEGIAGVDFIDSFDDKNLTEPVIKTSLVYQKGADMLARLSFEKRHDTSPYEEDIFDNWRTTASATRQVLERLRCSLSVFYGEGEYIATNSDQRFLGMNSTLLYDITKYLKGNFTYTYSDSDSEDDGYLRNTVFFGLTAGF